MVNMIEVKQNKMFELVDGLRQDAKIKVIGIGGGGGNAVEHMLDANLQGVEFICANTDAQALAVSNVKTTFQLGTNVTRGLGAGANPDVGRDAAEEDRDRIKELISDADLIFITAGMGGGTGTGAAPVIAEIARDLGILTVAVVTKPFRFEGNRRNEVAEQGITELNAAVDSIITVPNEKLLSVLGKQASLISAFKAANDVLLGAVQGISELITKPGLINVDFADVRTIMGQRGIAMMGSEVAHGENRAKEAAEKALNCQLLEDVNIRGARGVLVNITAGPDLSIGEFDEAGNIIRAVADDEAIVVIGTVIDPNMQDELRVTLVATGLSTGEEEPEPVRAIPTTAYKEVKRSMPTTPSVKSEVSQNSVTPQAINMSSANKIDKTFKVNKKPQANVNLDYLDLPAFLRRQAD